jgi:hypothetical protein
LTNFAGISKIIYQVNVKMNNLTHNLIFFRRILMKKVIFGGLIVFLAVFLVTCGGFTPSLPTDGGDETPSVQYSPDGKSVTLRLDGGGTDKRAARALTDNLAKAGHDYFEVVFNNGADVARASWELGEAAGIKNVPRDFNYSNAANAILFVGRKADKTLLAVGLLTSVDTGGTTITPTSTTATFTVTALTAGADKDQATLESIWDDYIDGTTTSGIPPTFVTGTDSSAPIADAAATTVIKSLKDINTNTVFPLYNIPGGGTVGATYTIGCTSPTTPGGGYPGTITGGIHSYLPGIRVAGTPAAIQPKIPRYPRGGGLYYEAPAPHASSTTIDITNNDTAGAAFVPGITFTIDINGATDNEGVISFTFEVPVYAISNNPMAGGPDSLTWYIRPGFGTNRYNLDDGLGSAGGAILLGVGALASLDWLWIVGAP